MIVFFFRNIYLEQQSNLDSWMGGGMRMFGKIDKMMHRVAGFETNIDGQTYFVNFRNIELFHKDDVKLRIMPRENHVNFLKTEVENLQWYLNSKGELLTYKTDIDTLYVAQSISVLNIGVHKVVLVNENEVKLDLIKQYVFKKD